MKSDLVDRVLDALEAAKKAQALLPPLPPDVKHSHICILSTIYRIRDSEGNTRITDINKAVGGLLPNTTKFINELVHLKVVEKSTLPTDKRVVLVHTTELGEQYIRRYILSYHEKMHEAFLALGEANCITMADTIHKVYEAMKQIYQNNEPERNSTNS